MVIPLKKLIVLMTPLVILICTLLSSGAYAETLASNSYAGGSGTQENPYQIATLAQLRRLSETEADWNSYFVKTADIDATETATWNDNEGFSPVGSENRDFGAGWTGAGYDGAGHTILGLTINRPESKYVGMFGKVDIGHFANVNLQNVDITGGNFVGGFIGYSGDGGISDCFVSGRITGTKDCRSATVGDGGYQCGTGGLAGAIKSNDPFLTS